MEQVDQEENLDPDVMKKLVKQKIKLGASCQPRRVNIWETGEFADDEEDKAI